MGTQMKRIDKKKSMVHEKNNLRGQNTPTQAFLANLLSRMKFSSDITTLIKKQHFYP